MNTTALSKTLLWTAPRCRSTVFERAIRELKDVKVYHEYYSIAAYVGEERIFPRYADQTPMEKFKYSDVKNMYESRISDDKSIFVKDMAYCVIGKEEFLPEGYNHTFLIRKPEYALTSMYRTITDGDMPYWADGFYPREAGFRELWQLYDYLKNEKGINPIVIDSDDVLNDPPAMLEKYCDAVGLKYTDDMLKWRPEDDMVDNGEDWTWKSDYFTWEKEWYGTVLGSSGFIKKSRESMNKAIDVTTLPEYVQEAIIDAQPFYEKMFMHRIMP